MSTAVQRRNQRYLKLLNNFLLLTIQFSTVLFLVFLGGDCEMSLVSIQMQMLDKQKIIGIMNN
jgi:hypothetical protein